jgi:predicted porin
MQKSLIALAVLSTVATAAQAQSSATIYGNVDTGVVYSNRAYDDSLGREVPKWNVNPGVTQGSYLGFKGVEDLGDGLEASFELETNFSSNANENWPSTATLNAPVKHNSPNLFRQKSVIGLHTKNFGSISLGVQPWLIDDHQIVPEKAARPVDHSLDFIKSIQSRSSIRYNTPNLAGFEGCITYNTAEFRKKTRAPESIGFGGKYVNGPLSLSAAYYESAKVEAENDIIKEGNWINPDDGYKTVAGQIRKTGTISDKDTAGVQMISIGAGYHTGPAYLYGNFYYFEQPFSLGMSTWRENTLFHDETGRPKAYVLGADNNIKSSVSRLGIDYSVNKDLHLLADVSYQKPDFLCPIKENAKGHQGSHLVKASLGANYSLSENTDLYMIVSRAHSHNMFVSGTFDDDYTREDAQTGLSVGLKQRF